MQGYDKYLEDERKYQKALYKCSDEDLVTYAKYLTHPKRKGLVPTLSQYRYLLATLSRRGLQFRFTSQELQDIRAYEAVINRKRAEVLNKLEACKAAESEPDDISY